MGYWLCFTNLLYRSVTLLIKSSLIKQLEMVYECSCPVTVPHLACFVKFVLNRGMAFGLKFSWNSCLLLYVDVFHMCVLLWKLFIGLKCCSILWMIVSLCP